MGLVLSNYRVDDDDCIPPRDTSPHQDSTSTAPSGTPPPAQPPPPPLTWETQSHSAPTPLKRPMLTPKGGPRPRVCGLHFKSRRYLTQLHAGFLLGGDAGGRGKQTQKLEKTNGRTLTHNTHNTLDVFGWFAFQVATLSGATTRCITRIQANTHPQHTRHTMLLSDYHFRSG